MTEPLVSFVILTKNNVATIRNCLESISQQDYSNFEVLVVDDNSIDGTIDIIKEYIIKYDFIMHKCNNLSIGAARQFGVDRADGEFIASVDSDCELPDNTWLTMMMKPFVHDTAAVSWTMGDYKKSFPSIARYSILCNAQSNGALPLIVTKKNYMPIGMGHTIVRKSVVNEVGGFQDMVAAEDIDMTKKIVNAGYSLMYVNKSNVYHLHATSYQDYMKKYKRNVSVTVAGASEGGEKPDYAKFIIDNTIMPFVNCARGLIEDRDTAWLWHPIICYSKCFIVVSAMLKQR